MRYYLLLIVLLLYCIILTLLHSYITRILKRSEYKFDKYSTEEGKNVIKDGEIKLNVKARDDILKRLPQTNADFKIRIKYNEARILNAENKQRANKYDLKTNLTHSGSFQNISRIFILSAFYDGRTTPNLVRVITLQEKTESRQLLCWFKKGSSLFLSKADQHKMSENHGRTFEGRIYSCPVPTWLLVIPKIAFISVGINTTNFLKLDLISLAKQNNQRNFGICIPPIFGSIPMTKLIQYFELTQILGASHFHLYLQNVSSSVHFTLNHYAKLNLVSFTQWELPSIVVGDSIWYHGQLLAIQDCLYRNMAHFKYLVFLDLDEFIIPRNTYNWTDMIISIKSKTKNAHQSIGFSFKSAFFDPWQIPDPSQQLSYLQFLERSKALSNIRTKVMVEADQVFEMGIHHLSKPISDTSTIIKVTPDIAMIHHYRSCITEYEHTMKCQPKLRDTMILKYRKLLQDCYKHRVKEIFKQFKNYQ